MQTKTADNTDASSNAAKLTPLMAQWWDIKSVHPDKIVLFRMGDFFEMFQTDAEVAAPVLGIALTARNKKSPEETKMCGVPHHSVAGTINKLLQNGFRIAICDQIEDPKLAKGLVKRAVTRILSPGVVFDPDTLDTMRPNYISSFDAKSVSFLDTTTGEAFYFHVKDPARRLRLLRSLQPVELVLPKSSLENFQSSQDFEPLMTEHHFSDEAIAGFPKDWPESSHRLLAYAVHMQSSRILETILPFELRELLDRMELPATATRHLELFETYKGDARGSLFHAINRCRTSSGARLLKQWLQFPLVQLSAIERRLDLVQGWTERGEDLKTLRTVLGGLGDVQRRLGKLGNPSCNPRDLQSLAESLRAGLEVCKIASKVEWSSELCGSAEMIGREIERTIVDEPPIQLKNGGIIRKGYTSELDELIDLSTNSHQLILELEAREREMTGITSLKVRFNNVFGFYIEITNTHKDKVPKDRYERKQTLANAERYLTKELEVLESKVLSAQAKRLELETRIFEDLVKLCLKEGQRLLKLAGHWAEVDAASSLAWLSIEENYVRPKFSTDGTLALRGSRHPVIEQTLKMPFVANDVNLAKSGCLLLTGPNMAGKSTIMRQIAVAAILAQTGSYVPAREATLPVYDRIFTRIGASDFLSEGLSTFMVEMKETAEMLESATENSLVILDEVGRGTSTYDGMSLAQAILEYLLESKKTTTLFATHYHELTELAAAYPKLLNAHMSIFEKDGNVTFLHQLVSGPANKSYGIHVGRLAGLPPSVTRRAGSILKKLEGERHAFEVSQMSMLSLMDRDSGSDDSSDFADGGSLSMPPEQRAALDELKGLDLGSLTPLEALNRIAKWQQSLS